MGAGQNSGLEAFCDLERYLAGAHNNHLGLPEVERESVRRGREVVRLSLQAHIEARGDGDVGPAVVVDGPGGLQRLGYKRLHSRRVVSLVGAPSTAVSATSVATRPGPHPASSCCGCEARVSPV